MIKILFSILAFSTITPWALAKDKPASEHKYLCDFFAASRLVDLEQAYHIREHQDFIQKLDKKLTAEERDFLLRAEELFEVVDYDDEKLEPFVQTAVAAGVDKDRFLSKGHYRLDILNTFFRRKVSQILAPAARGLGLSSIQFDDDLLNRSPLIRLTESTTASLRMNPQSKKLELFVSPNFPGLSEDLAEREASLKDPKDFQPTQLEEAKIRLSNQTLEIEPDLVTTRLGSKLNYDLSFLKTKEKALSEVCPIGLNRKG